MATQTPKPTVLDGYEVREMTVAELAQHEIDKAEAAARSEAAAAKAAARQAVLDKLGLTANEAQALLG
jgi:hypothetical protein